MDVPEKKENEEPTASAPVGSGQGPFGVDREVDTKQKSTWGDMKEESEDTEDLPGQRSNKFLDIALSTLHISRPVKGLVLAIILKDVKSHFVGVYGSNQKIFIQKPRTEARYIVGQKVL